MRRRVELLYLAGDLVLRSERASDLMFLSRSFMIRYDPRIRGYRTYPMLVWDIEEELRRNGFEVEAKVSSLESRRLSFEPRARFELRDYQERALEAWLNSGGRGVVVLPTGAGKTYLAIKAIERLSMRSLIVVPTLNLLEQWRKRLLELLIPEGFEDRIGILGGGRREIDEITIATYDSAYTNRNRLRNFFGLVIFDEVHHLPAQSYRRIALACDARYRLGLTATPERSDQLHEDLDFLVGRKVFEVSPRELEKKGYVASYDVKRIYVSLTPEEERRYRELMEIYRNYLSRRGIRLLSGRDYEEKIIRRIGRDRGALKALRAHQEARRIALNAEKKIEVVGKLLEKHASDKVIIFTEFVSLAKEIARRYLLPLITHETDERERIEILDRFAKGEYTKIVTGRVLDEGLDVADARIGIVVSGSGQRRQAVQRLGRLLRPKRERAILYEIVTRGTVEVSSARRRRVE